MPARFSLLLSLLAPFALPAAGPAAGPEVGEPEEISFPDRLSGGEVRLRREAGLWTVRLGGEGSPGTVGSPGGGRLEVRAGREEARRMAGAERVSPAYRAQDGTLLSFHLDELTVRFRSWTSPEARREAIARLGASVLRSASRGEYLALRLPPGLGLEEGLRRALAEPAVLLAEPRYLAHFRPAAPPGPEALPPPDDPLVPLQWHIENEGGKECFVEGADINLLQAWEVTRGKPEVVIAVVDSGMDLEHPDLRGQLFPRGDDDWNFSLDTSSIPADSFGHGTAVGGLAGAEAGNGQGVAGVCPGCRLMPLKVDGLDLVMNFVEALDYLVAFTARHSELRVVANGSINLGPDSQALRHAVTSAYEAGVVLCFSAGNGGGAVERPAAYPEGLAVGAVGPDGRRKRSGSCEGEPWGSAHGPELDLTAPGVLLPTTDMTGPRGGAPGDYDPAFGGTSAASPIAAGVAALVLSANPRLSVDRVREILFSTASDLTGDPREDTPGWDEFMGHGRIDAGRAVARAAEEVSKLRGDVNCDGRRDLGDVGCLLDWIFQARALPCLAQGDANADGRINIADPVYLVVWLFYGGPAPID